MKERPILFSAPMVRAILDGSKTQTRRGIPFATVEKPQGAPHGDFWRSFQMDDRWYWETKGLTPATIHPREGIKCPYGKPGDRLWVRETFAIESGGDTGILPDKPKDRPCYEVDYDDPVRVVTDRLIPHYKATDPEPELVYDDARSKRCRKGCRTGDPCCHWIPAIHMPRWASRITLETVNVRVERLQDISQTDAICEGAHRAVIDLEHLKDEAARFERRVFNEGQPYVTPRAEFAALWESINGKGSWTENPFVWVIEFKRLP